MHKSIEQLKAEGEALKTRLAHAAKDGNAEAKAKVSADITRWESELKQAREAASLRKKLGNDLTASDMQGVVRGAGTGNGLYAAAKSAGFHPRSNPSVIVSTDAILGKTALIAAEAGVNPIHNGNVADLGRDTRFLYPNLSRTEIPFVGAPSQVQYLRQSARTLPTLGTATLAFDHTGSSKPVHDLVMVLATADTKTFGVVSNPQAISVLDQPGVAAFVNRDLAFALARDFEDYVLDLIAADANINTASQGTDTVVDALYKAANDIVDDGFSPNLLVLNKDDAENIDLAKDANDRYMREPGSPLFGMKRVTSNQVAAGTAYVLDTSVIQTWVAPTQFLADPYGDNFAANAATLKAEFYAVAAISQGTGICKLTLS